MKIQVKNLRGVTSKLLTVPQGVSALCGDNGTGKSTMALAPYFVLTGKGLSIKNGEASAEATVHFSDDLKISRSIEIGKEKKTTIKVNGTTVTEKALKQELERRNLHIEVMEKMYSSISTLSNDDMLKAVGLKLTVEDVLQMIPLENETPFRNFFSEEDISIPSLTKCEKYFTEVRKNAKKEVKNLEAKITDLPQSSTEDTESIKTLGEQIRKLQAEKEEVQNKILDSKRFEDLKNSLYNLESRRISLQNDIGDKKAIISDRDILKDEITFLSEKETSKAKQIKSLNEEITTKRNLWFSKSKEFDLRVQKIKDKEDIIKKLENSSGCPLYAGVSCTTNMSSVINSLKEEIMKFSKDNSELKKELEALKKEGTDKNLKLSELNDELTSLRNSIKDAQIEANTLNMKLSNIEKEENMIVQLDAEIKEVNDKIKSSDATTDIEELEMKKTELSELIEDKRDAIYRINSDIASAEKRNIFEEELEKQSSLVISSDEIIKAVRKLPEIIFQKLITPLEDVASNVFSTLKPEWRAIFKPTGDVEIEMTDRSYTVFQEELSSGERTLLNYCLKVVIATLIGLDTIIVDNADSCDKNHYNALVEAAQKTNISTLLISPYEISDEIQKISI